MKTYQSVLLHCLLLAGGYSTSAQKINAGQVPAPVQYAFKAKFASATDIDWKKEGSQFKTSFDMGDVDHEALYTATGKLVSHSYDIPDAQLPAAVRTSVKNIFPNHKMDDADRIESNGAITYKVELDGRPDVKAIFAADGKLISQKEDND